mmetsp:Transcript_4603/g.11434  ORF Transcript_4603/g.11434 Transcript_4603/m.11434 type:complete len:166 (-) Transcript_4603:128-625(-)
MSPASLSVLPSRTLATAARRPAAGRSRRAAVVRAEGRRNASKEGANSSGSPDRRAVLSALVAAGAVGAAPNRARAASVFEGEYSDPKHPGCKRQVDADGRVSGTDGTPGCEKGEAQKPWALQGTIDDDGGRILIDFSPKGGPKDLVGVWTGKGIAFPDGNLWSKK